VNTIELNWTTVTYLVIGLLALSGFIKGWWKEAITTFFLGILILLLRIPAVSEQVMKWVNEILQTVNANLPQTIRSYLSTYLGISSLQVDATQGLTWLVILLVVLGVSILVGRMLLPGQISGASAYTTYAVTPLGSFLGGLLGGLNGFLIINLVREYLDGRGLPASTQQPATEIAMAGSQTVRMASSGVGLQLSNLPDFTLLTSLVGWIVVAFGFVLLLVIVRNTISQSPPGYEKHTLTEKDGKAEAVSTPPGEWQLFW
jgi:hypothetical protein